MPAPADALRPGVPQASLARRVRALWRIARSVVHLLYGLLLVALFFAARRTTARSGMGHAQRWSAGFLRVLGVRLEARGTPRPGAKLIVANHVSWLDILAIDAVRAGALRLQGRGAPLAAVRPPGGRRGHALHRARPRARRVARRAPDGRGAAGRRHAGGVSGRHDRPRARAAALPRQPAAGGDRDRHAGAAGGAALLRRERRLQRGGRVRRRDDAGAERVGIACAEGLCAHVEILPAQSVGHADRRRLAARLRDEIAAAIEASTGTRDRGSG